MYHIVHHLSVFIYNLIIFSVIFFYLVHKRIMDSKEIQVFTNSNIFFINHQDKVIKYHFTVVDDLNFLPNYR